LPKEIRGWGGRGGNIRVWNRTHLQLRNVWGEKKEGNVVDLKRAGTTEGN